MKKLYNSKEVIMIMSAFADEKRNLPIVNDEMKTTIRDAIEFLENHGAMIDLIGRAYSDDRNN